MRAKPFVTEILALAFAMLAVACAPASDRRPTPVNTSAIPGTGGTATSTITASATAVAITETPAPTETMTATATAESDVTLMVNRQGDLAPNLVDDRGRSLYVYINDEPNSSLSACVDDCAVEWPPLTVLGTPAAGEGVDAILIGTISRPNRSSQATYNGWPLYYYNSDSIPGTTFGQRYNGVWFLISPSGELIRR